MARRCFLIVNPTSGSYSQGRMDRILASLRLGGVEPILLESGSPAEPALFAGRICAQEPDPLIVAVGGDGTVNGVLNGLAPGKATLGVVPLGTSNVLARELNIGGVEDALGRLVAGKSRQVSVGEIESAGHRKRFILMAGIGVDGAVVQGVRLREKRVMGKGAYLLSALRLLLAWDDSQLQLTCSGGTSFCHSVIVCNAAKYGGDFLLAPGTDLFTPGFRVICIRGGRLTYLKLALLLALGKVAASRSVTLFDAEDLEISGGKAIQLDGDYFGCETLRLRSLPDFVRLIV